MSRFAIDPRWLLYLPPTMSPVATSTRADLLEHPDQAFDAYRADGVASVVCEEKHMGSRAVAAGLPVARRRRGPGSACPAARSARSGPGPAGPSSPPKLTAALVDQLRAAADRAGLFDELGTSWLLLDAELLPWTPRPGSCCATSTPPSARPPGPRCPPRWPRWSRPAPGGLPERRPRLLERTQSRQANAAAFTAAYRRYCWPTDGLAGVRVAPFQLLASEGAVYHERPHAWHLDLADRLAAAAPSLIAPTRRVEVETADPASVAAATRWWEELTAAGGEGMVVKPAANLTRGRQRALVQPGLKVRGREYLRIIYGPDYTEPANLARLRQRGLGHKRSLALREYALGLEALDRVARGEPLWRVHECVFAVLALESEPVDPRL